MNVFYKKKISSHSLAQAFSTAGEAFEVIADNYKIGIVVPYNSEARDLIADLSADNLEIADQKRILRKLQRYTVGIGKYRKENWAMHYILFAREKYWCCVKDITVRKLVSQMIQFKPIV